VTAPIRLCCQQAGCSRGRHPSSTAAEDLLTRVMHPALRSAALPDRQVTGSHIDSSRSNTEPDSASPGAARSRRAQRLQRLWRCWSLGHAPGLRDVPVDEVLVAAADHELPRGPRRVRSAKAQRAFRVAVGSQTQRRPADWQAPRAARRAGAATSEHGGSSKCCLRAARRRAQAADGRPRAHGGPGPHLARDGDLVMLLVPDGAASLVGIVEHDGHAGLRDARLPLLVHQLLQVARAHLHAPGARARAPRAAAAAGKTTSSPAGPAA